MTYDIGNTGPVGLGNAQQGAGVKSVNGIPCPPPPLPIIIGVGNKQTNLTFANSNGIQFNKQKYG